MVSSSLPRDRDQFEQRFHDKQDKPVKDAAGAADRDEGDVEPPKSGLCKRGELRRSMQEWMVAEKARLDTEGQVQSVLDTLDSPEEK